MHFDLPDGNTIHFPRLESQLKYGSRTVWLGKTETADIFLAPLANRQLLTGQLMTDRQTFAIKPLGEGLQVLIEFMETDPEGCEADYISQASTGVDDPTFTDGKEAPQAYAENFHDECFIRVLVAYTTQVGIVETDPLGLIMTAISMANDGYNNSGIDQQLQLVRVYETAVSEANASLSNFRDMSDGYMDEVHGQRNLHDADLCALISNTGSGVAYTTPIPGNGFSQTNRSYIPGHTFTHELGHNHGCFHDPANNSTGIGSSYQGYGHPSGLFRTIMAYPSACGASPCTRINQFSNPSIFYVSGGVLYITGTLTQNNAAGHNNNNGTVVDHRLIPTWLSYTGDYEFRNFELANFAAETTASYSSSVNQMTYYSGSVGSFTAGESITLGEGFSARAGSVFTAYLDDNCTQITREASPEIPEAADHRPEDFNLDIQLQPNPTQGLSIVSYQLEADAEVRIELLNLNGQQLQTVLNTYQSSGQNTIQIDVQDLAVGTYVLRVIAGEQAAISKLIVAR